MANTKYLDKYDDRYDNYRGKKRFEVTHPEYRTVIVAAPDDTTAIIAAAGVWRVKWTKLEVYADCRVTAV